MKKRTTKQIFAETFLEMAKTTPIDKIRVTDLVKQSGCSVQSFYNNFDDKYDLLVWLHGRKIEELVNRIGSDGFTFGDYLGGVFDTFPEYIGLIKNAVKNTAGIYSYYKLITIFVCDVWTKNICRRFELETLPEDIDFLLKMYIFGTTNIHIINVLDNEQLDRNKYISLLMESVPDKLRPYILA